MGWAAGERMSHKFRVHDSTFLSASPCREADLRAERLASGAEILRMRRKNFKRWSKTERSDKFCPPHPSREAHGRRAARIKSGNSANQEEEPVAVWSEAKLRDREKMKRPSGNRTAFSFKGE